MVPGRPPPLSLSLLLALTLASPSTPLLTFINPPPFGIVGDFSQNAVFPLGSSVTVQWTGGEVGEATSLGLFQMDGIHFLQPMEHIVQSAVNITSFRWIVATQKNLTVSNMFMMSLIREGNRNADSNSHYFNLSRPAGAAATAVTILPTTTTAPETTAGNIVSTLNPSISPPSPQPSNPAAPKDDSGASLPTAAAVGMELASPVPLA